MTGWQPAFRRALAYSLSGAWERAVAEFTQALESAPDDPRPWVVRGYAFMALKEQEKAAADVRNAIELPTEDARCLRLRAWLCLALGRGREPWPILTNYSRLLPAIPSPRHCAAMRWWL